MRVGAYPESRLLVWFTAALTALSIGDFFKDYRVRLYQFVIALV
jgi:hypothetical protein